MKGGNKFGLGSGKYWWLRSDGIQAVGVNGPSSTGYGKLLLRFGRARVSKRETEGKDSCRMDATRAGGLDRLAVFAARRVLQSRSVFGKRDASFGVRGEGDEGREPLVDPPIELVLEAGE